jgi:hypothetical protein
MELEPEAALRRQMNYSALLRADREGSVMSRSPQDEWVRAPLGRWFPNLHYALTGSREGSCSSHLQGDNSTSVIYFRLSGERGSKNKVW